MNTSFPSPDLKKWREIDPSETSDNVFLFSVYSTEIGFGLSAIAILFSWMFIRITHFPLFSALPGEWWDVLAAIGLLGLVLIVHELLHAAFSNWNFVRFTLVKQHGSISAELGGEMSKLRFILCGALPTIVLSIIGIPVAYFISSPLLMSVGILNLGLSGVDWTSTIKLSFLIKGSRVYCDGEKLYDQIN